MIQAANEDLKSETKSDEEDKWNSLNMPQCIGNDDRSYGLPYYVESGEFLRLFVWCVTLLLSFGLGRLLCFGNGNYYSCRTQLQKNVFDNLSVLLLMGIALFFFTGAHSAVRFNYIYGFTLNTGYSGMLFLFTFSLTPVAWKGIDTTPFASLMFTADGLKNNTVPLVLAIAFFLFTVCWHIYTAYRAGVLLAYLVTRCLVLAYLILGIGLCQNEPDIEIHVHHYQIGWFVALLGCFNHPISVITLAFGAGLFVEGLATYGADSMFVPVE